LVGQYLKGFNSTHGILVLFRLDKKRWDIPDMGKGKDFKELVDYLQGQARSIKDQHSHVRELVVFGIDCTGSEAVRTCTITPQTSAAPNGAAVTGIAHTTPPSDTGTATEIAKAVAKRKKVGSRRRGVARKQATGMGANAAPKSEMFEE
jgi:hypothetical protein